MRSLKIRVILGLSHRCWLRTLAAQLHLRCTWLLHELILRLHLIHIISTTWQLRGIKKLWLSPGFRSLIQKCLILVVTSKCCCLFVLRHHRWISLHDRDNILHQVLDIGLIPNIPSSQVRNSNFILKSQIRPLLGNTRVKLLIYINFRTSDWVSTNQNYLDREG